MNSPEYTTTESLITVLDYRLLQIAISLVNPKDIRSNISFNLKNDPQNNTPIDDVSNQIEIIIKRMKQTPPHVMTDILFVKQLVKVGKDAYHVAKEFNSSDGLNEFTYKQVVGVMERVIKSGQKKYQQASHRLKGENRNHYINRNLSIIILPENGGITLNTNEDLAVAFTLGHMNFVGSVLIHQLYRKATRN